MVWLNSIHCLDTVCRKLKLLLLLTMLTMMLTAFLSTPRLNQTNVEVLVQLVNQNNSRSRCTHRLTTYCTPDSAASERTTRYYTVQSGPMNLGTVMLNDRPNLEDRERNSGLQIEVETTLRGPDLQNILRKSYDYLTKITIIGHEDDNVQRLLGN